MITMAITTKLSFYLFYTILLAKISSSPFRNCDALLLASTVRTNRRYSSSSSAVFASSSPSALPLSSTEEQKQYHARTIPNSRLPQLQGDWSNAKLSLRNVNCCVVTISNIEQPIAILRHYFCNENAHSDLDLRMRVRSCRTVDETLVWEDEEMVYQDCEKIFNAIMGDNFCQVDHGANDVQYTTTNRHRCILALAELARGMASLTDGDRLMNSVTDVHLRLVCASKYAAIDPLFHTDKCPLRGYVTLIGPGTELMDETCLPWEYAALRSGGKWGLLGIGGTGKAARSLKMANELEFIVMKGDEYDSTDSSSSSLYMPRMVWNRSSACVHRSPSGSGERRVILSLDLADGKDDQEWYEVGRRREWRSGMTQRKSHLVS